jgi:CheY-like chemotaxis protein
MNTAMSQSMCQSMSQSMSQSIPQSIPQSIRKSILVVDDEAAIRFVIQACLEELAGWEVLLADSGAAALELALEHPIDAILLDVSMPGMNGFETLAQLRSNPDTSEIPVAFLTAQSQGGDRALFAQLEIAGVMDKPFDPIALVGEVTRIFSW